MEGFVHQWHTPTDNPLHMDVANELQGDGGFEPQTRARSNTWPCPRPENFVEPPDDVESTKASIQHLAGGDSQQAVQNINTTKKNSSRRNAWGNLSYADLITHAIGSAPDKRLTLSQIYEWMVQNVPYFKDKGDSNSSAGWKNSIRHNLSLHNRFMRVQNEGTGKSSWWMLNPDAKPGKSVRRRAASMETSRYEKRRGRAKKRVEALRQAGITGLNDATPSPSSSISEGLDHFSESPLHSGNFQLSPDFRQRASSNASSCGRLSPIPALIGLEPDWSLCATDYSNTTITPAQSESMDELAGSIAEVKLPKDILQGFSAASGIPTQPPPPYQAPQQTYTLNTAVLTQGYGLQQQCLLHRSLSCSCLQNSRDGLSPSSVTTTMSPAYQNSEPSSDSLTTYSNVILDAANDSGNGLMVQQQQQQVQQVLLQQRRQQQQQQSLSTNMAGNCPSTFIGQCMEALNSGEQIDEFTLDNFQPGLECNLEELIRQEMSIDGTLDINIPLATDPTTVTNDSTNIVNNALGMTNSEQQQKQQQQQQQQQQQLNQLQIQLPQQQQHHQQQQQPQLMPSLLNSINSNNNNNNINNSSNVLELPSSAQTQTNLNARVQYSQASVVTPPSWVH